MGTPIRILIVDDHPFFRQGVRLFLESLQDFVLIGEAESGEQALQVAGDQEVDVVLMDLAMPGMDGISATEALLKVNPALGVLVLTSFGNEEKIKQAIAAGASGYCLKDAPPKELTTAINAVAAGGTYLGRGITPKVLTYSFDRHEKMIGEMPQADYAGTLFAELTQRELEVLEKLARGLGNKGIARELYVSEKTVKTHVANILGKLNVKTRIQAALLFSEYKMKGGNAK